jgi:hypothetical protein
VFLNDCKGNEIRGVIRNEGGVKVTGVMINGVESAFNNINATICNVELLPDFNTPDSTSRGVYIEGHDNTVNGIIRNSSFSIDGKSYGVTLGREDSHGVNASIVANGTKISAVIANSRGDHQNLYNTFAIFAKYEGAYNQVTCCNLTGVTRAVNPGSAYTTDGSNPASLPGEPTSFDSFGVDGVCGCNVV